MDYFHGWLRTTIKGKYRSLRKFAQTAGIEVSHFYQIVNGVQYPSPYTLSLIFKTLGTDPVEQKDVVWHSRNKF